jgi:hypothetical protein
MTFLRNHRDAIAAMDFFVVSTVTFRILYIWFAIEHGRRRIVHFHVADHPTRRGLRSNCARRSRSTPPCHLMFDRERTFSAQVLSMVKSLGAKPIRTAPEARGRTARIRPSWAARAPTAPTARRGWSCGEEQVRHEANGLPWPLGAACPLRDE